MARDKDGNELLVGDVVILRARVDEIHQIGDDESKALIKVTFETAEMLPVLNYLKPGAVEKCPT